MQGRSTTAFADTAVDVICFGHSHQPLCARRDSLWLVNPGSATDKRRQPRYSFVFLNVQRGLVHPSLVLFGDRREPILP